MNEEVKYPSRLEEIRKELEAEDPGKQWHKLAWELLAMAEFLESELKEFVYIDDV